MTARKPKTQPETVAETAHEAEHEQGVVSEAKPAERLDATAVAARVAEQVAQANRPDGNRLTFVFEGPNGLVQTFHATVEEGIREF